MAVPWQVMNKIRSKLRAVFNTTDGELTGVGEGLDRGVIRVQEIGDKFFTYDRDTKQIV